MAERDGVTSLLSGHPSRQLPCRGTLQRAPTSVARARSPPSRSLVSPCEFRPDPHRFSRPGAPPHESPFTFSTPGPRCHPCPSRSVLHHRNPLPPTLGHADTGTLERVPPWVSPTLREPSVQPASRGFKRPSTTRRHHSSRGPRRPPRPVGARCNVPLRLLLAPGVRPLALWSCPASFAPTATGSPLRERLRMNRSPVFCAGPDCFSAITHVHLEAPSTAATPYIQGSATRI
jgi:hypothetical protein